MKRIILLVALLAGCGTTQEYTLAPSLDCQAPKVVHGSPSTDQRSTVYVEAFSGYCTGVYVGPGVVLSAEHCNAPTRVLGYFGELALVDDWIDHPEHDVRIIFLASTLPLPEAPIGIPNQGPALVQGYGRTLEGYQPRETGLNEATVEILGFEDQELVAGSLEVEGPDTCNGDSGGPIYQNGYLVGLTSRAYDPSAPKLCGYGGVYAIPAVVGNWITEHTGILTPNCN